MKKILLVFAAVGFISFMSCKDTAKSAMEDVEETTDQAIVSATGAAQKAGTTIDELQNVAVEVPTFSNPELQKFADEYGEFFQQVRYAAQTGDEQQLLNLQNEAPNWTKRLEDYTQQMTPEDMEKWEEWSKKIADLASITE